MAKPDIAGSPRSFSSFTHDSEGDHGHVDFADGVPSGHHHQELQEWLSVHLTGITWCWLGENVTGQVAKQQVGDL